MQRSVSRRKTCRNNSKRPSGRFFIRLLSCLILLVVLPVVAQAQKRVSKSVLDPDIRTIVIDGRQCFAISLETTRGQEVTVEASMEGEYQGEVLIQTERLGNTLRIGTGYTPVFNLPNDKLGAHKVLSVRLRVVLPEDQRVELSASRCQVTTSGIYRDLKVHINGGVCRLDHRAETTRVRTFSAPITALVSAGEITAESRYGKVEIERIPPGNPYYSLRSTSGNIRVQTRR